jgi:hypothetical protein
MGAGQPNVIIIETSSTVGYSDTRAFNRSLGSWRSRRSDFSGPGDAKVTFWKSLSV